MRILYGVNSQGHGHFAKAAVLVPLLEARGHVVRLVSSGPPPSDAYRFSWHRHLHGLPYAIADGCTDYGLTFRQWVADLPKLLKSLRRLRKIVRQFEPDLVISDFEPLTANPLIDPGCEVIALSRQVSLGDRSIPLPDGMAFDRKLTRTAVRIFTAGAHRRYGYHYEPASFRCVPPVIRPEIHQLRPETGEHVFVYNHLPDGERLVDWASRRRQPVRAYGFANMPRGLAGFVDFRPPGRRELLEDVRTARAVITSAGLSTPLEAILLNKPVCVVPIPGQWEQIVNAFHLQQAGLAAWETDWNYDRLLELPPPGADHPLLPWLRTHPDCILDQILDEQTSPLPNRQRLAA